MITHIDLTHVALILSLAFLGGLFLQRLRQPALVGYILVGALIGPGLLGLQGEDASIKWLAELAVVLLMFMIGLELDVARFRKYMSVAIIVTLSQIALSLGAMFALSHFLFHWEITQTVLFGFVVSLSSTAVAVTILRELGQSTTLTGRIATKILVAQDIAAIPMLLIISAFRGGTMEGAFVHLIIAILTILVSIFAVFELIRHPAWYTSIERFLTAGAKQPVIAGLALCFAAAAISGNLGLSTAYGAFIMGLVISNIGPHGKYYREATHPFHELLMMIFFLSIGLMLDIGFVIENLPTISFVLGITLILKTAGNALILRLLGAPRESAYTLGATLGQVGEFSFVLIALGLSNGFIGTNTYQLALAVIALSLVISPLWLTLVRRQVLLRP